MASVNKVIILGNLGANPELRYLPNGAAVCTFSVATTRGWKDKESGDRVEDTEWHQIKFYDRLAEVAGEYLRKGRPVYVEGRLKTEKYTDKDGVTRYPTFIIGEDLQLLGDNGQRRSEGESDGAPAGGEPSDAKPAAKGSSSRSGRSKRN